MKNLLILISYLELMAVQLVVAIRLKQVDINFTLPHKLELSMFGCHYTLISM